MPTPRHRPLGSIGVPPQPPHPVNRSTRRGLIIGGAVVAVVVLVAAIGAFFAFGGRDDPEPVEPLNNAVLATSEDLSCAIAGNTANGGDLYCWGYGGRGELMLEDGQSTSLEPVRIKDLDFVTAVSIDPYGTVCAISRGELYCWGANESGQVGNGSSGRSVPTPTKVAELTGVTAVSNAFESTCAVAGGLAFCWGNNEDGQLGDGTTLDRSIPTRVEGLTGVTEVAPAKATCAIAAGEVYCWGSSDFQQIPGKRNDTPVPVKVEGIDGAAGPANGGQTVCALSGGGAYCCDPRSGPGDSVTTAVVLRGLRRRDQLPVHLRGRARRGLLLGRQLPRTGRRRHHRRPPPTV